jgi:hypothetical protein
VSTGLDATISEDEWLARYIFHAGHVRADGTIKPDAFIPYKHTELSVTRHAKLSDEQVWQFGDDVGRARSLALLGRADTLAKHFVMQRLRVIAAPLPDNENHANVVGWPPDKQSQKEIAIEVARFAKYKPSAERQTS